MINRFTIAVYHTFLLLSSVFSNLLKTLAFQCVRRLFGRAATLLGAVALLGAAAFLGAVAFWGSATLSSAVASVHNCVVKTAIKLYRPVRLYRPMRRLPPESVFIFSLAFRL